MCALQIHIRYEEAKAEQFSTWPKSMVETDVKELFKNLEVPNLAERGTIDLDLGESSITVECLAVHSPSLHEDFKTLKEALSDGKLAEICEKNGIASILLKERNDETSLGNSAPKCASSPSVGEASGDAVPASTPATAANTAGAASAASGGAEPRRSFPGSLSTPSPLSPLDQATLQDSLAPLLPAPQNVRDQDHPANVNLGTSYEINCAYADMWRLASLPSSAGHMPSPSARTQSLPSEIWRGYDVATHNASGDLGTGATSNSTYHNPRRAAVSVSEDDTVGAGDFKMTADVPTFDHGSPLYVPTSPYQLTTPEIEAIVFRKPIAGESVSTSPAHHPTFLPSPVCLIHSGKFRLSPTLWDGDAGDNVLGMSSPITSRRLSDLEQRSYAGENTYELDLAGSFKSRLTIQKPQSEHDISPEEEEEEVEDSGRVMRTVQGQSSIRRRRTRPCPYNQTKRKSKQSSHEQRRRPSCADGHSASSSSASTLRWMGCELDPDSEDAPVIATRLNLEAGVDEMLMAFHKVRHQLLATIQDITELEKIIVHVIERKTKV